MTWIDFGIRVFAALFLGGAIGLERQWRQARRSIVSNGLGGEEESGEVETEDR
jgi:putative Mg2+ transporter-C (MgtC) family protein